MLIRSIMQIAQHLQLTIRQFLYPLDMSYHISIITPYCTSHFRVHPLGQWTNVTRKQSFKCSPAERHDISAFLFKCSHKVATCCKIVISQQVSTRILKKAVVLTIQTALKLIHGKTSRPNSISLCRSLL